MKQSESKKGVCRKISKRFCNIFYFEKTKKPIRKKKAEPNLADFNTAMSFFDCLVLNGMKHHKHSICLKEEK